MAIATKVPVKKSPGTDFKIGQKLEPIEGPPSIIGITSNGRWAVEEIDSWGCSGIETYTTAELKKKYRVAKD